MFILVILILYLALYIFATTMYLSVSGTGTKQLPAMRITDQTRRGTSAPVKFCPKCGKSFDGHSFCTSNGTYQLYALIVYKKPAGETAPAPAAPAAPAAEAPKVNFCRHCGQKITTPGAFCSHCGSKL